MVSDRFKNEIGGCEIARKQEFILDTLAFYMSFEVSLDRMERIFFDLVNGKTKEGKGFNDLSELTKLCMAIQSANFFRSPLLARATVWLWGALWMAVPRELS